MLGSVPTSAHKLTLVKVGNRLTETKVLSGTTTATTYSYPTTSNKGGTGNLNRCRQTPDQA